MLVISALPDFLATLFLFALVSSPHPIVLQKIRIDFMSLPFSHDQIPASFLLRMPGLFFFVPAVFPVLAGDFRYV